MIIKSSITTIFLIFFLSIFCKEIVVGFITCYNYEKLILKTFKEQVKELTYLNDKDITSLAIQRCDLDFPIIELVKVLEDTLNKTIVLEKLSLFGMIIRTEIFVGLENIVDQNFELHIDLPKGKLPINTFSSMSQLQNLFLHISSQNNLPDFIFIQKLKYLNVVFYFKFNTETDCHTLIYNLFNETQKHLQTLEIKNDIYSSNCILRENTFSKMIALENLRISMFAFTNVDDTTFSKLTKLNELHLVGNKLNNFSLDHLPPHLQLLDLGYNNISSINITKSLDNLIELDLRFNKLETLTLDLENQLVNLEKLRLYENPLKHLDIKSPEVLKLKSLDLENVYINNFDFWFWAYQHMETTVMDLSGSYPPCICDLKEKLKLKFNNDDAFENVFRNMYCRVPLSECGLTTFGEFTCHTHICNVYKTLVNPRLEESMCIVFNCSNIEAIELNTKRWFIEQNIIKNIVGNYFPNVHFLFDDISTEIHSFPLISSFEFGIYQKFHISASNSRFKEIGPEIIPSNRSLVELNLKNNLIQEIDIDILEKFRDMKTTLKLSGNPIKCICEKAKMYEEIVSLKNFISDFDNLTCSDGTPFFPNRELCISLWTVLSYIAIVTLSLVSIMLGFYLKYSLEVQVFIYSRGWFPKYFRPESDDTACKYDAFLSFSEKDEKFVLQILKLLEEDQNPPFKVCYHHRDWIIGEQIDTQIINSVEESRKTIIVLSHHFTASHWANMEFTTAHYKMLEEKSPKILLILHGDIETADLRPELKSYIKTTTYLKSDDKWFEKKLLYSLRRPQVMKIA
uniref:CSON003459 protein n=1 Tax=Culicoides sonorensis TaxID=179676 RepID=A0A336MNZ0_CULSO